MSSAYPEMAPFPEAAQAGQYHLSGGNPKARGDSQSRAACGQYASGVALTPALISGETPPFWVRTKEDNVLFKPGNSWMGGVRC